MFWNKKNIKNKRGIKFNILNESVCKLVIIYINIKMNEMKI